MELDCNNNCMEFERHIESNLPSSPDINDIVGAPQLNPRLGNEYQVQIPSVTSESEGLKLTVNPADSEAMNESLSFALGLPVPLIWIDNEVEDGSNERQERFRNNDGAVNAHAPEETSDVKPNITSDNEKDLRPRQQGQGKAYGSAPDKLSNSWSDADIKSFLLALFIFGKNFIQIKRFLENKGMGQILSFYYGKFYKSDDHVRWSDCRKIKGRKCMTGLKLFNGWRQHELLSRINSKVSEPVQDSLLQVSESYAEGRASLQEYIFSLKATVGLSTLVEAVAIGKDKADLTSFAAEHPKINPCKAWSSLEPCDIIKYLTGGFRLSKAKSNDLFWEAVWPRLLARGWHSEQPNNNPGFVSSRDYLVFLIPGVNRFSRRKLVKGDHYFDSVSDVLSKVVSEPNLLELEFEEGKVRSCNEDGWIERASDKDDQSDCHRHCYLKPRVSSFKTDHMKFTVVDTSLKHGGKSSDLREVRSLPPGFKITSQQTNQVRGEESETSRNTEGVIEVRAIRKPHMGNKRSIEANSRKDMFDSTDQKLTKFTIVDTGLVYCGKLSRELRCMPVELKDASRKIISLSREVDGSLSDYSPSEKETIMQLDDNKNRSSATCHRDTSDGESINGKGAYVSINNHAHEIVERCQSQKTSLSDDKQLKKTIKQLIRRARSDHSTHAAPPIKRRRLTACVKAESSRVFEIEDSTCEKPGHIQPSNLPEDSQKTACLIAFSVEVKQEDNKGRILNKDCLGPDMSCIKVEKCDSQPPINLNLHQLPPKSENGEKMEEDKCLKPNDANFTYDAQKQVPKSSIISGDGCSMEQKTDVNPRRQSTRNRPLTVRALESIENEFLYVQRKQKKKKMQTPDAPFSPCRRARTRAKTAMHCHSSSGGSSAGSMQEKLEWG